MNNNHELDDEQQGSKWSIQEVGDSGEYNRETESDDEKKEKQYNHYFVLFTNTKELTKLMQKYRGYIIKAHTEEEFARVLHKLMQQEERLNHGIQVNFTYASDHDNDLYRILIKCKNCAHCKFAISTVDDTNCFCEIDSEDFLPIEKLLALECKNCGSSQDMRLNSQDFFQSCFEFHLICNNISLRTPTIAQIDITTLGRNGRKNWNEERSFAVCFHNMDTSSTENKMPKKDRENLEKNQENVLAKMGGEQQVIELLIQREVLSSDFQVENLTRNDLIGKLLRHLFMSGDVLPQFITCLRDTQLPQNLELADILCNDN